MERKFIIKKVLAELLITFSARSEDSEDVKKYAEELRESGVTTFAVGVGDAKESELRV